MALELDRNQYGSGIRVSSKGRNHKKKNYVEERAFQNVSLEMKRFRLFFDDARHEKAFRLHYYIKSKTVVRICICGLILISLIVFILDYAYYNYEGV